MPGFLLNTPNPLEIASKVKEALLNMTEHGLPATAPVFYAGHSLGSTMVQDYLFNSSIAADGLVGGAGPGEGSASRVSQCLAVAFGGGCGWW
jgi:hypothetical protein